MEIQFETQSFKSNLKSMISVDFKRMFKTPLIYILMGIAFVMPILILIMTTMMAGTTTVNPTTGEETVIETFTNVWQIIGMVSGSSMSMDLTGMCNINLLYFITAIFVCIFVGDDFRSGFSKNLFTVRSKKIDYCISKTLVCFVGGVLMFIAFFIGTIIGGAISGLPFDMESFGVNGLMACLLSKIFIIAIFVSIALVFSTLGKHKLWLSILLSLCAGMLLFTMIPMIAPLDASLINVIMCFVGGALFAIGLGCVSNLILNKTSLV